MATVAKRKKKLMLSREVKAFAKERGLTPYLSAIVEVFHRVFKDAKKMSVEVDPEIANLHHLLFRAVVPWRTFEEAYAARIAWHRGTEAVCPKQLLTDLRLSIDRRPR